jgi:AcrR family transcriptional regulator
MANLDHMSADRAPDRTASVAGSAPAARLTAKGGRTRQRIVAAAAGLVFERGVAGTTIEDVQAAAEVSASQLYHYFPSRTTWSARSFSTRSKAWSVPRNGR